MDLVWSVILAVGILAFASYTVNRRMGIGFDPVGVPFFGHLIGFFSLLFLVSLFFKSELLFFDQYSPVPVLFYISSAMGVFFVVVGSFMFPGIGISRLILFSLGAQLFFCGFTEIQVIGVMLIMVGTFMTFKTRDTPPIRQ